MQQQQQQQTPEQNDRKAFARQTFRYLAERTEKSSQEKDCNRYIQ